MKKPYWTHKKYKTKFKGSYRWINFISRHPSLTAIAERVFVLTNGKRTISFESHQSAKKQGWGLEK
jgi:hypothetical protein